MTVNPLPALSTQSGAQMPNMKDPSQCTVPHVNRRDIKVCPGEITPYDESNNVVHQPWHLAWSRLAMFALGADDMKSSS
jgi:hypothetical protein